MDITKLNDEIVAANDEEFGIMKNDIKNIYKIKYFFRKSQSDIWNYEEVFCDNIKSALLKMRNIWHRYDNKPCPMYHELSDEEIGEETCEICETDNNNLIGPWFKDDERNIRIMIEKLNGGVQSVI